MYIYLMIINEKNDKILLILTNGCSNILPELQFLHAIASFAWQNVIHLLVVSINKQARVTYQRRSQK
jgi:hypothetical protein